MTITDYIDPNEDFVPRELHPKPIRLDAIDPENVVISFDRRSDTLLVHLFGRGRGSVSVPVSDYLYVMVDPDTEEPLGIHVEGFLSRAVKEIPEAIELLEYAELRGITAAEVRKLQRETVGAKTWISKCLPSANGKSVPKQLLRAIASFMGAKRSRSDFSIKRAIP